MNFRPIRPHGLVRISSPAARKKQETTFQQGRRVPISIPNLPLALFGEQYGLSIRDGRECRGCGCSLVLGAALIARGAMRASSALRNLCAAGWVLAHAVPKV